MSNGAPVRRRQVDALAKILYREAKVPGTFDDAGRDSRAFYRKLARGVLRRFELLIRCRECGCTDLDCSACIERTGMPCRWIPDLETDDGPICSACIDDEPHHEGATSC